MKKIIFLATMFCASLISAQITTQITSVIPANAIPTNANVPSISTLSSPFVADFTINLAGTLDNANDSIAFSAILAAVKTEIDSNWIVDSFGLDPTLDIVGRIYVTDILRRFDNFEPNNLRGQYLAATNIYRVRGKFKWVLN